MEIFEAEDLLHAKLTSPRDSSKSHLEALTIQSLESLIDVSAVGFDTNVLKILRRNAADADQLFVVLASHQVSLIAPAQTIVEYWNNHQIFASEEWSKFQGDLTKVAKLIDSGRLGGYNQGAVQQLQQLVGEVSDDLLEAKKPEYYAQASDLIRALLDQASSPQVSRTRFSELAAVRQASKIPPGFADEKLKSAASGDFFVWCDYLLGALTLDVATPGTHCLWVTDDSKPDWKTGKTGHPSLIEEFRWVTEKQLVILSYEEFRRFVTRATKAPVEADGPADTEDDQRQVAS